MSSDGDDNHDIGLENDSNSFARNLQANGYNNMGMNGRVNRTMSGASGSELGNSR